MIVPVLKVFILTTASFGAAFLASPVLTHFLYKYKCWKKSVRTKSSDGSDTPIFASLHKDKETKTPRMGGLLIWIPTLLIAAIFFVLAFLFPDSHVAKLNFVSRSQTWIPLFTLFAASMLGLFDDILVIKGIGPIKKGAGITFRVRALIVTLIGLVGAYWFYFKLGISSLHIPFVGDVSIGIWYIPLFVIVMIVLFSGGVIDGVDGLSGGVFASMFAAYAAIAFMKGQYDLAAFSGVVSGATLAFLWFNIPPARFYMTETGILGLTTTLSVIAFLTDTVFLLPFIGFIVFVEIASVAIQLASKKFLGRKVFLAAPIHHHFEAKGWPNYKVTMRFWLVSAVSIIVGLIIFMLDIAL